MEGYCSNIPAAKRPAPDRADAALTQRPMVVLFRMEYHPIGGPPRRIRVFVVPESDRIRHVTEERQGGGWIEIDSAVIEYFEYADESGRST